jgi:hypothetical protein
MKNVLDFFTGVDGEKSSKRFFLFVLMICFVTYFMANLFGKYEIKESLEDNTFFLIIYMYTGITVERFRNVMKPGL